MKRTITFFILAFIVSINSAFAQESYLGDVKLFAGSFAPRGWELCQGQLLPINKNQSLFSLLGTMYGGDGITTFALPDLRGRAVVGIGNSSAGSWVSQVGQSGGTDYVSLPEAEIPAHNHKVEVLLSGEPGDDDTPSESVTIGSRQEIFTSGTADITLQDSSISQTNVGAGLGHYNMQPSLGMNYIICLQGLFPSRN